MHAFRGGDAVNLQRCCQPIHRGLGGRRIELRAAAQKMRRIEIAKYQVGIRHRRIVAAMAVTRGPGHRAGALRADMQDAAVIDTAYRSAAGAETDDVEAVQREAMSADAATADQGWLAIDDQADIGAGAAHVERDQIVRAEQLRRVTAAGNTAGRAGQHAACRESRRFGDRCHAAMRLNDQDRAVVTRFDKSLFQPTQIA